MELLFKVHWDTISAPSSLCVVNGPPSPPHTQVPPQCLHLSLGLTLGCQSRSRAEFRCRLGFQISLRPNSSGLLMWGPPPPKPGTHCLPLSMGLEGGGEVVCLLSTRLGFCTETSVILTTVPKIPCDLPILDEE